jgi:hypothetical protein
MLKQQYRRVLEALYGMTGDKKFIYDTFIAMIPELSDPLLTQKISFYIHEMIEMPDVIPDELTVKLRLHAERAEHARMDLEQYLQLRIKEQTVCWRDEAKENGWGPVSEVLRENEELKARILKLEALHAKYAKGKQEMYAMGGEVAKAAFKCFPHGDVKLSNTPLTK